MRNLLCVVKAVKRRGIGWISLNCFVSRRMVLLVYYLRTSNNNLRGHLTWNQFDTSFLPKPSKFFLQRTSQISLYIRGNKMPTRCNRGFYCRSYCLLNMFRAPLCPTSAAQEYYTVVDACGISCCGFQVAGLVWS